MNDFVKNFLRKIRSSPVIIICGIFCVILGFFVIIHRQKPIPPDKLLSCSSYKDGGYKTDAYCVERVVAELIQVYSTGDLLKYIAAASASRDTARNPLIPHLIGHFIGKQTFLKTGSIEAALEQCKEDTGYGCLHGAIGAAAAKELGVSEGETDDLPHAGPKTIERVAAKYCASDNIQLCHAVGHILFQVLSDQSKALAICGKADMEDPGKRETCARGVFMESSGPTGSLSPDQSHPASMQAYLDLCKQTPSEYQHACFRYLPRIQTLFFENAKITSITEQLAISIPVCKNLNGAARADCIEAIGFNAKGVFSSPDYPNTQDFCDQFDAGADRQSCILGIVGLHVWKFNYQSGVNYCHTIADSNLQDFCYKVLFQTSDQVSMGSAMQTICHKESTSKECNQKLKEYRSIESTLPDYSLGLYGNKR
ncbi:MAG: hypothetical protein Q8R30_05810 [bacterium]|nr:hypothetical protein [bacterium]